jgi:hypothetical protein
MRTFIIISCFVLMVSCVFAADAPKPKIKVAADGFPAGHDTPEGVACDLARSFIERDVALFTNTCIKPFGGGVQRTNYEAFLKETVQSMKAESAKKEPSPGGPKAIKKVFAARHLSQSGQVSFAYAMFDFRDLMFVDIKTERQNGNTGSFRILVVKKADEKWYVYPTPQYVELMSAGLNSESDSTQDFLEVYEVQK